MANIKADEITKILREQIENYQQTLAVDEVGSVISVGDGIARANRTRHRQSAGAGLSAVFLRCMRKTGFAPIQRLLPWVDSVTIMLEFPTKGTNIAGRRSSGRNLPKFNG